MRKDANMWGMKKIWQIFALSTVGMLLVACSVQQQQQQQQVVPVDDVPGEPEPKEKDKPHTPAPPKKKAENANLATETAEPIAPTPEQQAAAEHLLNTTETQTEPSHEASASPEPQAIEETASQASASYPAGIPGRRALRMGQYAPPEEAVSSGEAAAYRPNRAEQHGFRSPVLPSGLPMDIHGKLTGQGNQ